MHFWKSITQKSRKLYLRIGASYSIWTFVTYIKGFISAYFNTTVWIKNLIDAWKEIKLNILLRVMMLKFLSQVILILLIGWVKCSYCHWKPDMNIIILLFWTAKFPGVNDKPTIKEMPSILHTTQYTIVNELVLWENTSMIVKQKESKTLILMFNRRMNVILLSKSWQACWGNCQTVTLWNTVTDRVPFYPRLGDIRGLYCMTNIVKRIAWLTALTWNWIFDSCLYECL